MNVDIDELFVYPYSDVVGIGALLGYLSENSYTAVVANMLDMFPEEPLSEVVDGEDALLKELCRFYDLSNVREEDYDLVGDVGNVRANRDVAILKNGITHTLFRWSAPLIKHPLIFLDDKLKPMDLSEHWVGNARIADFTGTLLHYKLLNRLFDAVRREVESRSYPNRGGKYDKYLAVLGKAPRLLVKTETARELESPNDLVGTRFMVLSEGYLRLVEKEDKADGNPAARHTARLSKAFLQAATQAAEGSRKVSDVQERLNQRTHEVRRLKRRLKRRIEQLNSVQQQLEGVVNSRSWRLLDGLSRARKKLRARIEHVVGR